MGRAATSLIVSQVMTLTSQQKIQSRLLIPENKFHNVRNKDFSYHKCYNFTNVFITGLLNNFIQLKRAGERLFFSLMSSQLPF